LAVRMPSLNREFTGACWALTTVAENRISTRLARISLQYKVLVLKYSGKKI
jgi:hypothetical protein